MLPDHVAGAEVMDQKLEEIGFCRVFTDLFAMDRLPYVLPGRAWIFVNLSDYRENGIRIHIDQVINILTTSSRTDFRRGSITQQIPDESTFFFTFCR